MIAEVKNKPLKFWPAFISFAMSFFFLGLLWDAEQIKHEDWPLVVIDILIRVGVALIVALPWVLTMQAIGGRSADRNKIKT